MSISTEPLGGLTILGDPYSVFVIKEGYAETDQEGNMRADGTITLIKGPQVIMVDTGSPWDRELILQRLTDHGLQPADVTHVVCTHGHSDHVGNLNLFTDATCLVSYDICRRDHYLIHNFRAGVPYVIDSWVEVIPTPGHTGSDTSVLVRAWSMDYIKKPDEFLTPEVLYFGGLIGGGILILIPAIHIQATGRKGCCANRCGMFLSIAFAAVGVAGSLYSTVISILGLVYGPLCFANIPGNNATNPVWTSPFKGELESFNNESYLFNKDLWSTCIEPKGVVEFNVILFSVILSASLIQIVLCLIQMINGLFGCLCGTCRKDKNDQAYQ